VAKPLDTSTIHKITDFVSISISKAINTSATTEMPPTPHEARNKAPTKHVSTNPPARSLTLQDLGFPLSGDEAKDCMDLDGINLDDIDPNSEDEDLLDD
jgi:hypothetical protein